MSATMRAKLECNNVDESNMPDSQELTFYAVSAKASYDDSGLDEDNTFAKFTPNAKFEMTLCNPALFGKIEAGDVFYVDFTPAD